MNLHSDRNDRNNYNIIDLSVPIDVNSWEPNPVKRTIVDHRTGADLLGETLVLMRGTNIFSRLKEMIKQKLGYGLDHRNFPEEKGLSLYTYQLTTHTGTHLDAPYHFGDVTQAGTKAKTITDIPLKWCFGNGVLLDVEADAAEAVSRGEIIAKLEEMNYRLQPFDIVLLKTGGDQYSGTPQYFTNFRGVSSEATEYLIDCGVKIIGIDSFGFDPPFGKMIEKYLSDRNVNYLWPAHFLGRKKEYCHIERLANLGQIANPIGFKVCCFPIKLTDSDAGWCRVVAIEG
ncbi:MAG TPA: cyclase family protein [Methylomusa anaerophila]|uniref:Kynurenine formamidase n=1 Tax=Methylomusa anaerophila TaxID=1930071 RepID=A0A348AIQ1_9FIRM|nr:cyclase family protein [Methylomusa anaerophila]BBB90949.1 kynurenine formamidase [Methylomusa anaerophila]HML90424.1 cyclase family protein [Methylomusa anaerophila]